MPYPTVVTKASTSYPTAVLSKASVSPMKMVGVLKDPDRRKRSIRGLTRKYAGILNFGRKTVFDIDLPDWDEGYSARSSYPGAPGTVMHVDSLPPARFKDVQQPNLISSKIKDGLHAPIIDVDFPVHVIESQTPGHYHLAFDKVMTEYEYFAFLEALEEFGIIEEGYKEMSIKRGASLVRVVDDLDVQESLAIDDNHSEANVESPW